MTRSVTIVNTSNWDNEPCLVNGTLLHPGEKIVIGTTGVTEVKVEPVKALKEAVPFGDVSAQDEVHIPQVLPEVSVRWVRGSGMLRKRDKVSDRKADD